MGPIRREEHCEGRNLETGRRQWFSKGGEKTSLAEVEFIILVFESLAQVTEAKLTETTNARQRFFSVFRTQHEYV